jgi:hypothetical protein
VALFDAESAMLQIKALLKDGTKGLNAQITAINSDKAATDVANYGKAITLASVNDKAIYFLVLNYSVPSFDPLVGIMIRKKERDEMGGETIAIEVKVAVLDKADGTVDVRALRYLQALENIFMRNRYFGGLTFSRTKTLESQVAIDQQAGKSWREVGIVLEQYYPMY